MSTDQSLKNVLLNYRTIPLDVVSLAEARQSVENSPTNLALDQTLKANITLVLDFISTELQYVAHERRTEMTLGEFLKQHPQLNAGSLQEFGSDMLRRRLEKLLGRADDINDAESIEWEMAQGAVKTNPVMHHLMEEEIKGAAERGKKANLTEYAEGIREDANGSQTRHLKEVIHVDKATGLLEGESQATYFYKMALADAKDLTKLRTELIHIKNYFENSIMQLYVMPEIDVQKLESLIKQYTHLRF